MIAAPIVLHQILDGNININREPKYVETEGLTLSKASFDWSDINIGTRFRFGRSDESSNSSGIFFLYLRVIIDNKMSSGKSTDKLCPYTLDIEKRAAVSLTPGIDALGDPMHIIAVNGAGLIWSSIRELVLTMTARMAFGPLTLPAVNFLDLIPKEKKPKKKIAVKPPKR